MFKKWKLLILLIVALGSFSQIALMQEAVEGEPFVDNLFATVADYEAATGNRIASFGESPMLSAMVETGELPPVEERLPSEAAVVRPSEFIGEFGGELTLIGWDEGGGWFSQLMEDMQQGLFMTDINAQNYYPNIAKGWELSEDGMTFTIFLREGMKWSDGDDFNADDWVFWYESILQNPELTVDISNVYMPGGELMGLSKVDDYTIELTFAEPFFRAVEAFSRVSPYQPEHFLKQYLPEFNENAEALATEEGFETWQQAVQYHADGGSYTYDLQRPQLYPWVISSVEPGSVVWSRNPYYWRVDPAGNQLPYIDTVLTLIFDIQSATSIAPVRLMAGQVDWEIMGLSIGDYPVLRQNEEAGNYRVYLFEDTATSTALGFALNYTHKDPILREIFNDLRFREALSLAIDRDDINETIFFGLTQAYTAPASPAWSGYEDWMGTYYAEHDVDRANALLDEMGLGWDANHEWRLRPDGQVVSILGEWATEYLGYTEDLLNLVAGDWAEIGVRFDTKFASENTLFPRYVESSHDIGIWNSDGGGETTARSAYPIRLMPPWHWMGIECCAMSSYPWRLWLDTNGEQGEEPPDQIKELYALVQEWLNTPTGTEEYTQLINQIIRINVENLYFFGTVSAPPRVVVVNNRLLNMPGDGGFVGGSMFGPYLPETAFIHE